MALQQGNITITGRVGAPPQAFGANNPPTICSFRLACTRGYYDAAKQWVTLPTTWITVKAYRALAANALLSLKVGDPVIVTGVLGTDEWTTDAQERRSKTFIEASNIGHDLNYGTTCLQRQRRDGTAGTAGMASGAASVAAVPGGMPGAAVPGGVPGAAGQQGAAAGACIAESVPAGAPAVPVPHMQPASAPSGSLPQPDSSVPQAPLVSPGAPVASDSPVASGSPNSSFVPSQPSQSAQPSPPVQSAQPSQPAQSEESADVEFGVDTF